MANSCDECGADGVKLQCICEEETSGDAASELPVRRVREAVAPKPQLRATPASSGRAVAANGPMVKCCRCMNVHNEYTRTNEWGKPAGKVVAGRKTWCPTGCGYHVTIPAND